MKKRSPQILNRAKTTVVRNLSLYLESSHAGAKSVRPGMISYAWSDILNVVPIPFL
jgi:hypothetical protein